MKKLLAGLVLALSSLQAVNAQMRALPPPVDLPIRNIPQETLVWCWVAVAQQIIMASVGPAATPTQSELVETALGFEPGRCSVLRDSRCVTTGSLEQIQALIAIYGRRASNIAPPTDPMTLHRTLASGRAVIVAVRTGMTSSHVVVVRGMAFVPNAFGGVEPVLLVNDPMSYFTAPVPYRNFLGCWIAAIVV